MELNNLLSSVAVVVALVAGGGLGLQRSRVSALRGDVTDLTNRVTARDQVIAELKVSDAEKDARISRLEIDLEHAEKMATGEKRWMEMRDDFRKHRTDLMARLLEMQKAGTATDANTREVLRLLQKMDRRAS